MTPTWHSAAGALVDRDGDPRQGTMSVFWNYDLGNWTFGLAFEHDPCWYDLRIQAGPLNVSFCYWRRWTIAPADVAGSEF